jgi:hypothetical protein
MVRSRLVLRQQVIPEFLRNSCKTPSRERQARI